MKDVFIGAATGGSQSELTAGIRKEMVRLSLARKIAAVALRIWKNGETVRAKKLNWMTWPFGIVCRKHNVSELPSLKQSQVEPLIPDIIPTASLCTLVRWFLFQGDSLRPN